MKKTKKYNGRPKALPVSSRGQPSDSSCFMFMGGVILMAALVALAIIYENTGPKDFKYKWGECLLNRAFEPVQVVTRDYDPYPPRGYYLRYLKVSKNEITGNWVTYPDWDRFAYDQTQNVVESTYTQIPCVSKPVPGEN